MPIETPCPRCGLVNDQLFGVHGSESQCIEALRKAMLEQREAAESLAYDLSVRYLQVLERLALDPGIGCVTFEVWDHKTEKPLAVSPRRVSGIFAAILREFRAQGDWEPLRQARKNAADFFGHACTCAGMLKLILQAHKDVLDDELVKCAQEVVDAAVQCGVNPPDLNDS